MDREGRGNRRGDKSNIYETKYSYGGEQGLESGKEYIVKVRGNNYVTDVFSALNGIWSSPVHFFSSEAPQPVTSLTSSGVTQNDATVEWTLHTDPFDQGYSTSLIYYLYMNDS